MLPTLEPMRWWHVEQVHHLELDLFDDAWSAEMLWSELAQPSRWYRVALDGDTVVGYAGLGLIEDEAHVQNIATAPAARRTGLGKRLLRELLTEAVRRGAPSSLLEVRADNVPAQALYTATGYLPIGVRRRYYQPSGTDAVVMRLHDLGAGIAALS